MRFASLAPIALLVACGGSTPTPVEIPAGFSQDPDVTQLLESKANLAALNPGSVDAHRSQGLALVANGGHDLAERCFRNALELAPDDVESHHQLARIHGERGDSAKQIQALERAVELDPEAFASQYSLGCALLDVGKLDEAERRFRIVRDGQPTLPLGGMGLALVLMERGRAAEAIPLFRAALEHSPDDRFLLYQTGQAYRAAGDEAQAKTFLERVDETGGRPNLRSPGTVEAERYRVSRADQLQKANGFIRERQYDRALPILTRLHQRSPADIEAANNLAVTLLALERADEALPILDASLEVDGDRRITHLNRAKCLRQIGDGARAAGDEERAQERFQAALAAADTGVAFAPQSADGHIVRAGVLESARRELDALDAYRDAISAGGDLETVLIQMIAPARRNGGEDGAVQMLKDALRENGSLMRIRFELCGLLLQAGKGLDARREQRRMARTDAKHPLTLRADAILRENGH